jgi:FkbH-like protein
MSHVINQKASYKSYLEYKKSLLLDGGKGLKDINIAIFSDGASIHIEEVVSAAFVLEGYRPIIKTYEYGTYSLSLFSEHNLFLESCELFVIFPFIEVKTLNKLDGPDSIKTQDAIIDKWNSVWKSLEIFAKPVIQFLYASPRLNKNIIRSKNNPPIDSGLQLLNAKLISSAPENIRFLETSEIFNMVGKMSSRDALSNYHLSSPIPIKGLIYAIEFVRIYIRTELKKRFKKLIVLDLDGTLWGGVIGDDGYTGIKVGEDSNLDRAYSDFCSYLKGLASRGILLAISSKNDEKFVHDYFSKPNPTGLLLDNFVDTKINWGEKYKNILELSEKLNISHDSFVFIDDNPVECQGVASRLPEVMVINVSEDPTQSIFSLDDLLLFDLRTTESDALRAQSYAAIEMTKKLSRSFDSNFDFLVDLKMQAEFCEAIDVDFLRLEQMEGKINQFNTTTRRRIISDIKLDIEKGAKIFTIRMRDKFADYGLISYLNVEKNDSGSLLVNDWLMSCRVFSRKLEIFILKKMLAFFGEQGDIKAILIKFNETQKNKVILDLLTECEISFTRADNLISIHDLSQFNRIKNVIEG